MRTATPLQTDYLGPLSTVIIGGTPYTVKRPTSSGWDLQTVGARPRIKPLTRSELERGQDDETIEIVRSKTGDPSFSTLSLGKRRTIMIKTAWLRRMVSDLKSRVMTSTGDVAIEAFHERHLDDVRAEIELWEKDSGYDHSTPENKRKATVGTVVQQPELRLSGRQLRRLLPKYMAMGGHPLSMRKKTELMGHSGPRLPVAIEDIIVETTAAYATEANQTKSGLQKLVSAKVIEKRVADKGPCERTIASRISDMPAARTLLSRKGLAKARKAFAPVAEGPEYHRVGERVEADCWNIPLMVLLETAGVLDEVPSEVVTSLMIVARRIHVAVVVDKATGYILGMAFGLSESSDLTTSALRMALSDKSRYVAWANCSADWSGCTGIEEAVSDAGPAYIGNRYQSAVYSACGSVQYAASGLPHLRGLVESIFSTLHKGFISKFFARAFENVVAKGDYNPQERAIHDAAAFLRLMVLYVVDVYHNLPRDGGLRQSPRQEYLKLAHGSKKPPNPDELRAWFGVTHEADLGPHGVRFMHVEYDSDWLLHYRMHHGLEKVEFLVDEENLGAISVLLDGDWVTVPAKDREFRGVPLDEWLALLEDLRRRFGEQADIDFRKFVAPALLEIERTNRTAEAALLANDNVGPAPQGMQVQQQFWTSERFRMFAESTRVRLVYDRDPEPGEDAPSLGKGTLGRSFARSPERPTQSERVKSPAVPPQPASNGPAPTMPSTADAPRRRLKFRED